MSLADTEPGLTQPDEVYEVRQALDALDDVVVQLQLLQVLTARGYRCGGCLKTTRAPGCDRCRSSVLVPRKTEVYSHGAPQLSAFPRGGGTLARST